MGIFIKKIKCPKCKSTNYTKVNIEDGNGGVSGVLLNAFDVGGRFSHGQQYARSKRKFH